MDYTTLLFLTLIALLLIVTGTGLSRAIYGNFQAAAALRRQYAQRIRVLPMFNMLRLRGVGLDPLLHGLPVARIEKAIRNCESCDKTPQCRTLLRKKASIPAGFCINGDLAAAAEDNR